MAAHDERQLRVLEVLHYIYGGVLALVSLLWFSALLGSGVEMVSNLATRGTEVTDGVPLSVRWILVAFVALALLLTAPLAGATVVAAKRLQARTNRTYCVVVAAINALCVPVGTVLGIVTMVTLMRPSVIELFEPAPSLGSRASKSAESAQ